MDLSLELNSSDFEDDDEVNPFAPNPDIGRRISEAIIANQATDRPLGKRNARKLEFAHGAPATRRAQQSVMTVWDAFCATIRHDPTQCPSGEQVFRFIDTRARRMVPSITGKTAPSLSSIRCVWRCLIDLLKFRHKDLLEHYSTYDASRIGIHLDQMATKGLLTRGKWRKGQWVGFKILHRLAQVWIERAITEGVWSWDAVLMKLLSVLLQSACAARAGDIARSMFYNGNECLCWRHLEMTIKDRSQPLSVQNLTLKITLEFTKGHKNKKNEDLDVFAEPMEAGPHNVMCVVKMLLIVALRLGRVPHTTIDAVLQAASRRFDGKVVWTAPNSPVLVQLARGADVTAYDKPAPQMQIMASLKEMALAAGLIDPVHSHDLRRGALRDVAYLSKPKMGAPSPFVAMVADHSAAATRKGVTKDYIGSIEQPLWNMRADDDREDRLAPKFAMEPFRKPPIFNMHAKRNETDAYMDENGMDKTNARERNKASRRLAQRATDTWREEQKNAQFPQAPIAPASKASMTPLRQRTDSEVNVANNSAVASAFGATTSDSLANQLQGDMANIDPQLLKLDEVQTAVVDENDLERLRHVISLTAHDDRDSPAADQAEADDEAMEESLAQDIDGLTDESAERGSDPPESAVHLLTGDAFVAKFASINVYQTTNTKFHPSNPADVAKYVHTGNSRDEPRPFLFYCSKCGYPARMLVHITTHEVTCDGPKDPVADDAIMYHCDYEGCGKSYPKELALTNHVSKTHKFKPKPCPDCPDEPDVIYATALELKKHNTKEHYVLDQPIPCPYAAECQNTTVFTHKEPLRRHLRIQHHKTPDEVAVFIPRATTAKRTPLPKGFDCPRPMCTNTKKFRQRSDVRKHLVSHHQITDAQAEAELPLSSREQKALEKKATKAPPGFPCTQPGCSRKTPFKQVSHLRKHLRSQHNLSPVEVEAEAPLSVQEKLRRERKKKKKGLDNDADTDADSDELDTDDEDMTAPPTKRRRIN